VVAEELANQIIGGTLAAGAVLPAEPVLGDRYGFSRTVIREAVKLLEERGLVRVEQGRGTTVQSRDAWNLLDPLVIRIALSYDDDMALLDHLMTVRRVLEREMAHAAATRLTDDELAELAANLEEMEAAYDDYERFRDVDLAFHAIVMRASGNDVGQTIVRTIHTHAGMMRPLAAAQSRAELERTATEHRAIFDALASRDGEAAGGRIAAHIDFAWATRKRHSGT
jgi:DNA-binding FadR family transcriptional regulator